MNFEIIDQNNLGRLGKLKTKHGVIDTPAVFPVYYTGIDHGWTTPPYWKTFNEINTIMFNASHIMMHKKDKLAQMLRGGLRKKIGFTGISFVDSGGWVYKRLKLNFSQEDLLRLQEDLDADIGSSLDFPIYVYNANSQNIKASIENAVLASRLKRSDKMLLFASIHGSDPIIVQNVIRYLRNNGNFDGFALGSMMRSFYNFELLVDLIYSARKELPDKPLHVYGLAGPVMTELLSYLGVDSMDSSFFMMAAANRMYATPDRGRIRASTIGELKGWVCSCKICKKHNTSEISNSRWLLALHNLWISWSQIQEFRTSLREGRLEEHVHTKFRNMPWSRKAFAYAKHRMRFGARGYT